MCYLIINNVTVHSTGKLNKKLKGELNIHDTETGYSELCRMHTWCSENGIALVTRNIEQNESTDDMYSRGL